MNFTKCLFLVVSALFIFSGSVFAAEVKIGVLNIRGSQSTMQKWEETANKLDSSIPEHHFVIVPLGYKEMEKAVADKKLDFISVNPTQYVELEVKYGVSRIATQISHLDQAETPYIGSVIFTKASRTDINSLSDLRGKSLATASKTAFAAWFVTRDEFKRHGISSEDLASIQVKGSSPDKVVMAVKNGEADAGAIITGLLEQMSEEGEISLSDYRVISQKQVEGFPFLLSSELYPNFAFARLKHTDITLANKVAAQLLLIKHSVTDSEYSYNSIGWTVPDNYESVRKLMQEWRIPPFQDYGKISLRESIRQHWDAVVLAFLSIIAIFFIVLLRQKLTQRKKVLVNLKLEKRNLENHHGQVVAERDAMGRQNAELEAALAQVKLLEGIIPICSYCKKIRDDQNSWQQLEQYISGHSEAKFSHGVCPHCFEQQMKIIDKINT